VLTNTGAKDNTDPGERPSTGPCINRTSFYKSFYNNRAMGAADPSGAAPSGSKKAPADPSGAGATGQLPPADHRGAGQPPPDHFGGGAGRVSKILSGAYETVNLQRKKNKTNPCLRGGLRLKKQTLGASPSQGTTGLKVATLDFWLKGNRTSRSPLIPPPWCAMDARTGAGMR